MKTGHEQTEPTTASELIEEFHSICKVVKEASDNNPNVDCLRYAHTYADAGLYLTDLTLSLQAVKIQLLLVQCNLGGWRGELARSTKARIKSLTKQIERGN